MDFTCVVNPAPISHTAKKGQKTSGLTQVSENRCGVNLISNKSLTTRLHKPVLATGQELTPDIKELTTENTEHTENKFSGCSAFCGNFFLFIS